MQDALRRIPGMKAIARLAMRLANAAQSTMSPFVQHFSAGHFYSPLPDVKWLRRQRRALFDRTATECPGVDLREAQQQEVLDELAVFYDELPFPASPDPLFRYHYENRYFSYGDAVVLYAMLRRLRPQRVVEVGSGFSSAAMLDIDERFLGGKTQFTFIEPHPERLLALLRQQDLHRCSVLQMPVQKVNLATFAALAAGDVLFVDSSHVVKIGNDVRHLLSQVLPRLRAGVVVHFHDIFWPFEYPEEWVFGGHAWNEAYFLHSFLQFNTAFEIVYFNSYMAVRHHERLREKMPLALKNAGGSLWLRKTA
ncbi:class I SAM-dependent methyltransferase [candidate division KSB1 bacterium]|nr:class I SAM-dependent methyltransferase [candidate division KSB1 bacterium]